MCFKNGANMSAIGKGDFYYGHLCALDDRIKKKHVLKEPLYPVMQTYITAYMNQPGASVEKLLQKAIIDEKVNLVYLLMRDKTSEISEPRKYPPVVKRPPRVKPPPSSFENEDREGDVPLVKRPPRKKTAPVESKMDMN